MNLAVATGMKQNAIAHIIASAEDPPDDLMASPTGHPRDLMAALGAEPILAKPQTEELLSPFRIRHHLQVKPPLKVSFPSRVVGVGLPLDLDMFDDRDRRCVKELGESGSASLIARSFPEETATTIEAFEVLPEYPPRRFVAVSPARPAPQTVEDSRIHFGERARTSPKTSEHGAQAGAARSRYV